MNSQTCFQFDQSKDSSLYILKGLFTGMSFLSLVEFIEAALTVGILVVIAKKARLVWPQKPHTVAVQ